MRYLRNASGAAAMPPVELAFVQRIQRVTRSAPARNGDERRRDATLPSMNQISDRLRGLVQSDIRRMSRECERVGGINLGQGICDLPTIPELVEGACDAISSSKATYSKFEGIDLLRERIAAKCQRFNGFSVDPSKELVVTVGSTGGFAAATLATLNAGDEVILFEPYYGYHLNTLKVLGIETKFVPLQLPDWSIDFDALRAAFGPKTRGIVVCKIGRASRR